MTISTDSVIRTLQGPRHRLPESPSALPASPGLYAIYGDAGAFAQLHLPVCDDVPLYVGKAEDSLRVRDYRTHFSDGRTGSSTVRRSFAALLRRELSLHGVPRNPAKPGYFSNYALSATDEAKLTAWMHEHLQIAVWPSDGTRPLRDVETEVLRRWNPPLNIANVTHPWKAVLAGERKALANEARAWSRGGSV
jgi:hypothetical protein